MNIRPLEIKPGMSFNCDRTCDFSQQRGPAHLLHHVRHNIPTRIEYRDIAMLPRREDFLDPELEPLFADAVRDRRPVLFMPNAVHERNEYVGGKPQARIYIYGVLPCGSKTAVIIEDVPVFTLISLPDGRTKEEFRAYIADIINQNNINTTSTSWERLFKIRGFQKERHTWLRINFSNLQDRKKLLQKINAVNDQRYASSLPLYQTANDDLGYTEYYFPVIARQFKFNTADWNRLATYSVSDPLPNTRYTLRTKLTDYVKLPKENRKKILSGESRLSEVIVKDLTMQGMWDIETYQKVQTGNPAPPADISKYKIFMLCSNWSWHWSKDSLVRFCCVDVDTPRRDDVSVVIVCRSEEEALLAHTRILRNMQPDILGAFNGGNFDWPCYRAKMQHYKHLDKVREALSCVPARQNETARDIDQWCFRPERIKIDAENVHNMECVAAFPGMIDTDILPIFLRLYSRAEVPKLASMNFFLSKNNIEQKADMPYKRMFKIYERALKFKQIHGIGCHCASGPTEIDGGACDCENHIKHLDYKPLPTQSPFPGDDEYTEELYPEIDGRCCWCTKRERNLADMAEVAYYCAIDCVRPQQLCAKRVITSEKRELSNMSYVSIYDSYYRADGMKVRNVIGRYAHKFGIAFSNSKSCKSLKDKDHYPGAWVCIPERLLNFIDPICGVDFASLYPSLMMTYNLSIDMVVYTLEEAKALEAEGYVLYHIEPFEYQRGEKRDAAGNQRLIGEGWMVRHMGITKESDTDTITTYRRRVTWKAPTGDTIEYYSDDPAEDKIHDQRITELEAAGYKVTYTYEPVPGRKKLPGERMGLFPYILKKLFDRRKPVKAQFLHWFKHIEAMEAAGQHKWDIDGVTYTADEMAFYMNTVDSKQKALKVLANTFYGESGNFRSSIFELLVAAGTTTAGVANITRVRLMVQGKGCHVHYGDTDSLYISPPRSLFTAEVAQYDREMARIQRRYTGTEFVARPQPGTPEAEYKAERIKQRLVLMEKKVRLTMKYMNDLKAYISLFLMRNNGTLFLNMAYEEVGLPTWFLGKKKYIMAAHMDTINFYPEKYFMRGIDIIKQGQTDIAVEMGLEMINNNMRPENESPIMEWLNDALTRYYTVSIPPEKFAQKAKYKPEKKNVPVLSFIDRMKIMSKRYANDERYAGVYTLPDPGDKFTYVIVRKETQFTTTGRRIDMKKGDRMEFLRTFRASQDTPSPLEIDTNWYMTNSISGILSRFIAGLEEYQPPLGKYDVDTKEGYRLMDKECIDNATKYINTLGDQITGNNPRADTENGRAYRSAYTRIKKQLVEHGRQELGVAGEFYFTVIDTAVKDGGSVQSNELYRGMLDLAKHDVQSGDGRTMVAEMMAAGVDPFNIWANYASTRQPNSVCSRIVERATSDLRRAEEQLRQSCDRFAVSAMGTIDAMNELINSMRITGKTNLSIGDLMHIYQYVDEVAMIGLYDAFARVRCLESLIQTVGNIRRAAINAKNEIAGTATTAATVSIRDHAAAARADAKKSAATRIEEYQW